MLWVSVQPFAQPPPYGASLAQATLSIAPRSHLVRDTGAICGLKLNNNGKPKRLPRRLGGRLKADTQVIERKAGNCPPSGFPDYAARLER